MDTTQIVTAKYTEVYDISTDLNKNVFYKIHTPTGVSHMKKLAGFYKQFKEYRYLGARIAWVHSGDYIVPTYEPALENTIETEEGASITKISDGVS